MRVRERAGKMWKGGGHIEKRIEFRRAGKRKDRGRESRAPSDYYH